MKNLITRSISGIIYVGLIIGAIFLGNPWFLVLTALFAVLAVNEFENILNQGLPRNWAAWVCRILDLAAALVIATIPAMLGMLPHWLTASGTVLIICYLLVRFTLALYDKGGDAFRSAAYSVLALMYIAVPLAMLNSIYTMSMPLVLATFVMIWLNDTGAYCVGSSMGRHRLFERLSPKKSWEGFWGGLAFCVASGIGAKYLWPQLDFGLVGWMLYGAMVSVLSTWGDLFESLLKRTCGVKDSGKLIPGHGGILDRIDSLLFVSMGTFVFILLFFSACH